MVIFFSSFILYPHSFYVFPFSLAPKLHALIYTYLHCPNANFSTSFCTILTTLQPAQALIFRHTKEIRTCLLLHLKAIVAGLWLVSFHLWSQLEFCFLMTTSKVCPLGSSALFTIISLMLHSSSS